MDVNVGENSARGTVGVELPSMTVLPPSEGNSVPKVGATVSQAISLAKEFSQKMLTR